MFPKSCDELFQCKVAKKKFLGPSPRYCFVFSTCLVINKDNNRKKADRLFTVALVKRVIWKYHQDKPGRLRAFVLEYQDQYFEYLGEDNVLQELKKHFAKLFYQARVQEEYVAQQVIGQGNYALVLELRHLHTQTKYASKCIDKQKLETIDSGMESVENEIRIMRILSPHDHLINLKEVYEGDSNIYLIMDLATGGSLYSEIKNRKTLFSRAEVQKIMSQILQGLDYMHSKNIMHRDLKPENVLFLQRGDLSSLRIADFGLAAIQDQAPYLYPKCGTPGFVAPEIANLVDKAASYSSVCDIFSAGVIFHILILGEGLFQGNGHLDILKQNKQCEINYNDKKYLKLDDDARDLLFKMLEVNPKNRHSARQCLDHPYFLNELPPQKLSKQNSTNSPVKDSFLNYLNSNNSPDLKAYRQNSKRLSIVTRTPLYAPKGSHPDLLKQQFVWDEISSFSLDQIHNDSPQEEHKQVAT